MSEAPIFIGGMPRSGTSLMRSIVGSHPDVAIFQWDLPIWTSIYPALNQASLDGEQLCEAMLDAFFSSVESKNCGVQLDRNRIQSRVLSMRQFEFADIAAAFLREFAELVGRPRWGLKTPRNEFFAEQIFAAYKNVRMVQLVRDPRDCSLSTQNYNDEWANAHDAMTHAESWQQSVRLGLKFQDRFAGRYSVIKYEDLVTDPENVIKRACETLALDFRPEMLLMNGHYGWRGNNSSFQRHEPSDHKISTNAIGRYQQQGAEFDQQVYQAILKHELELCGYTLSPDKATVPRHVQFAIRAEQALRGTLLEKPASKLRRHLFKRGRRSSSKAA